MKKRFDPMTGEPVQGNGETYDDSMTGEPVQGNEETYDDPMTGEPVQGNGETYYDPMTGEPVQGNGGIYYDPMTGEPVRGNGGIYYDPMTGEPVRGNGGIYYDPMTGEPVRGNGGIYYDPMTGEPVRGNGGIYDDPMTGEPVQRNSGIYYDPMTGKAVKRKKGGKGIKVAIAAAAIAVVGIAAVVGVIKSGVFLSKSKKVLAAAGNTMLDTNHLFEVLNGARIMYSDEYTMDVAVNSSFGDLEVSYKVGKSQVQFLGNVDVSGYPDIDFVAALTDKQLKVHLPSMTDDVVTYNYTEEKDGYLAEMMPESQIEMIDGMLASIYESNQKDIYSEMYKAFLEAYDELEFEKAPEEKFEVDGKARKCKGYATTLTADHVQTFIDNIEEVYKDFGYDEMPDDVLDQIEDTMDEMPDIDIDVYIYKDKLACIRMEAEGDELELQFLGGDTRMQNMQLICEGDELLTLEGDTSGSVETMVLRTQGTKVMELEYDYKSGDFNVEVREADIDISGQLLSDRKGITLTLDDMTYRGETFGGSIALKKGVSFEKINGKEFDLGSASESELEDFMMEFEHILGY